VLDVTDKAKRQLFLAKYRGILLEKDSVIRIVKSVEYSDARKIWGLVAVRAKQDEYDDRDYFEDPDKLDTIIVDVTRRKDGAQALIKKCNKSK
jgi:hypothetical protein